MANNKKRPPASAPGIRVRIAGLDKSAEYYADQFAASVNPWGAILVFAKLMVPEVPGPAARPGQSEAQATVRMSLEHAKVMTMAMRRALKQWEAENVEINIAPVAYKALDLSPEDW